MNINPISSVKIYNNKLNNINLYKSNHNTSFGYSDDKDIRANEEYDDFYYGRTEPSGLFGFISAMIRDIKKAYDLRGLYPRPYVHEKSKLELQNELTEQQIEAELNDPDYPIGYFASHFDLTGTKFDPKLKEPKKPVEYDNDKDDD